mgnify:CR=1 FL=1
MALIATTDGPAEWLEREFPEHCCQWHSTGVLRGIELLLVHQTQVDLPLLHRLPDLKGVIRLGVGYDKVDLNACLQRGVSVTNLPGYCTEEVALSTLAFVMDWVRGHGELEANLKVDPARWQNHLLARVRGLKDVRVGVIGAGRIGSKVMQLAATLGFQICAYDPHVSVPEGRVDRLETLLQTADVVSLHVPLQAETAGLIDAAFISQMKDDALLINTARGGLLGDVNALLDGIRHRGMSACFDVLPEEPDIAQSPLFQHWLQGTYAGRLRITPHNAFHSAQSAEQLLADARQELVHFLQNGTFVSPIL